MEFNKNISELNDNLKNINVNKEKYNPFNEIDTSELKLSLRGLDDYYFLINDTNEELRQHYDVTYKNNFKSDVFLKNLMFKRRTFLKHDIDYYYFIIPDKGIVCKDYLPFNPLFNKRNINSIDCLVDFADELNPEHYFKLDSHINYDGGKTLTYYFLNLMDNLFTSDKYEELLEQGKEKKIYHTFDLLTERNWSYSEEEKKQFDEMELISFKIPQDFIDADNDIPEEFDFDGVRKSEFFKNPNSFSDKRALIFRDSSANLLKWFFSFYFKEVFFYWDHGNINPNVIKWYKPDIIIELRTERLLDNIPVPDWVKNEEDFLYVGERMETVKSLEDINSLEINRVMGSPNLVNSQIVFKGYNNTIYCEDGVNLNNSLVSFEGNNSLIYLSRGDYPVNLYVRDNSTVYFGRDNKIISNVNINIQESQNFIMGDDGIIGSGVNIRSFDGFPIYDSMTKERINLSESIIIGDHVWIDHLSYITKGAQIGSGAIIGNHSFVAPSTRILSNTYVIGNPVQVEAENVFFTKEFTGIFNEEDTANSLNYPSDIYIYEFANKETLDLNHIDNILKDLIVEDRLEFVQKLFVRNKRKNRFTIFK